MNTMSLVSQITQHETGHTNSLGNLSASSFSPIHDSHVRALELKKNQGPLPCPECGKLFAKEFDIKRHMYTHTGEKPFKCDICGRGFSQKSTLKVHYNIHTGDMPYNCHLCGKKFRQKQGLNAHIKAKRCQSGPGQRGDPIGNRAINNANSNIGVSLVVPPSGMRSPLGLQNPILGHHGACPPLAHNNEYFLEAFRKITQAGQFSQFKLNPASDNETMSNFLKLLTPRDLGRASSPDCVIEEISTATIEECQSPRVSSSDSDEFNSLSTVIDSASDDTLSTKSEITNNEISEIITNLPTPEQSDNIGPIRRRNRRKQACPSRVTDAA